MAIFVVSVISFAAHAIAPRLRIESLMIFPFCARHSAARISISPWTGSRLGASPYAREGIRTSATPCYGR